MKICASIWSMQKDFYQNKIDTKGFIELAAQWGLDAVELLDYFLKNENEIEEVIELLESKHMPVASFSIENDFAVESSHELESQIKYVKESIDMAVRFKAPMLRVVTGNFKLGLSVDRAIENIISGLKMCVGYAEENGIIMVLENSGPYTGTSMKMRRIIEGVNSPYLKANTDTGNFMLQHEDPVEAVRNLADMISFTHLNDMKRLDTPNGKPVFLTYNYSLCQGTVLGEGEVDFPVILDILRDAGYDGYLSVEYEGVEDCIYDTWKSIAYVRSLLEKQ